MKSFFRAVSFCIADSRCVVGGRKGLQPSCERCGSLAMSRQANIRRGCEAVARAALASLQADLPRTHMHALFSTENGHCFSFCTIRGGCTYVTAASAQTKACIDQSKLFCL